MQRYLMLSLLLICIVTALSGCAAGRLTASDAFSYACQAGGDCGVFMTLTNAGSEPETLVGARTDVAARVELHTVVKDMQGGMKMQQVQNIAVPASGAVELKPGSLHIMLFGLTRELKPGDTFALTLQYERGGEHTAQVQVKTRN